MTLLSTSSCPSTLMLDKYICGELDPHVVTSLETHLQSCEACKTLVDDLLRDQQLHLDSGIPAWLSPSPAATAPRANDMPRILRRTAMAAAPMAAAAAVILWVASPSSIDADGDVRGKGTTNVGAHVVGAPAQGDVSQGNPVLRLLRPDGTAAVHGDIERAGARLQATVTAGVQQHMALFSIDGRGVVTLHGRPSSLAPTTVWVQPNAMELDDAPHFERFVLLSSTEELAIPEIQEWLQRLPHDVLSSRTALPDFRPDVDVQSHLIRKGDAP